ncbi:hypothetical protein L6164_023945 [Bauhinia variegata]|uniref:Uncharacterized protein n=1 Tax=Bauhinia variegata TaxID=167791 RepID=A0ACB9LXH9_BAUVA|nr:hypothetical protein L6164_023945 [Bauhinia variegata]
MLFLIVHGEPSSSGSQEGGMTMVVNEYKELISTKIVTGWTMPPENVTMCIDYHKLNSATIKYHFPSSFNDQILEKLVGQEYYCFLDGYLGYNKFLLLQKIRRR